MVRLLQILCVVVAGVSMAAADGLGELQKSFMARYDEANATRDEQLKKLQTSYLGALHRHMERVKASGELERVVPVRDEIEDVEAGVDALPVLPDGADRVLRELRGKYIDARTKVLKDHAGILVVLSDKMNEALKAEESRLTKAGRIDEALAARNMRETLVSDVGIAAAREVMAIENAERAPLGNWQNLLEVDFKVRKKGRYDPHVLGSGAEGIKTFAPLVDYVTKEGLRKGTALLCHAPAELEFRLGQHVRELRGSASLAGGGRVAVRVVVDDKVHFEKILEGAGTAPMELTFKPSRSIVLEVDPLGDVSQDWAYWSSLEVR